ncbi:hypothetical protein EHI8A_069230 [Entamoeba histolytica HM-1:IMSS-B]|uniref:Uncharacterized protein n=6 Tax=Entamoeba histolytica TaxID=5759 RepID=C4M6D3_ENTH1|nr:hypothetical protein EHI_142970 [Entamoeba histolytica HM-1:IMSS]EMD47110.1 Hypothetical protein EHI5A_017250 [Entamoeba histolytica KU27]EMH74228.1 hypothetical protein EHI8A_069230 [Entamoeba histolytica HM-1:IMSS-B]EMS12896.1 hypothetical protein KM1_023210 [Entamoeba histolytica HM-3:IMSS]ENY62506.1 hypothetical protein EHI7A_067130 [Entamoeba histolytica HM-1:IMSS-A]GAT97046.1 hypothetical protein CL6EHI_142970 [Entamoeba histolytica]|eukprot:XP_650478.1 hypothetical protein EHI_142970 [Entamoeba histolytica HM-1:IMSS]
MLFSANVLTYLNERSYGINNNYLPIVSAVCKSDSSDISHEFVSAIINYCVFEDSSELTNITQQFCEYCIIGNKTLDRLFSLFGLVFQPIKMVLFNDKNELFDVKRNFLILLNFFVKTGHFNDQMVEDERFIYNIFELLKFDELFVNTSVLLETLLDKRSDVIDITILPFLFDSLNKSYLHLGVFLSVMNYLIHTSSEDECVIEKNIHCFVEHGVIQKVISLLSLSTLDLAIIYLLQNGCIDEDDQLISSFNEHCQLEIETYPDIDIIFKDIQGTYAADIVSNILFVLSSIIDKLDDESQLITMKNIRIDDVVYGLYESIDVETLPPNYSGSSENVFHSLFSQFLRFVSVLSSKLLVGKKSGSEMINSMISDIGNDEIDHSFLIPLITSIEIIARGCNVKQREVIGTERGLIGILVSMIMDRSIEIKASHIIYDLLGVLIRRSSTNTLTLISNIQFPLETLFDKCSNYCVETSVFFRNLILNIIVDKIELGTEQKIKDITEASIRNAIPTFFKKTIEFINREGITSYTTCCMNTSIIILGIYSTNMQEIYQQWKNIKELEKEVEKVKVLFMKKYYNATRLKKLCDATATSKQLWESGLNTPVIED